MATNSYFNENTLEEGACDTLLVLQPLAGTGGTHAYFKYTEHAEPQCEQQEQNGVYHPRILHPHGPAAVIGIGREQQQNGQGQERKWQSAGTPSCGRRHPSLRSS